MPHVWLTQGNHTSNSLEISLARSDRASLADASLLLEVQVYKIIIISSSYDRLVQDQSYIISRRNNPTSPVLTLAHAKSWLTRAKSRLTCANEYIKILLYPMVTHVSAPLRFLIFSFNYTVFDMAPESTINVLLSLFLNFFR